MISHFLIGRVVESVDDRSVGLPNNARWQPYLTIWWLRLGYYALTILFLAFMVIYGFAAVGPVD